MSHLESVSDPAAEMTIAAFHLYPGDPAGAAQLFLRAAAAGNDNARFAAARMLIDGDGVEYDPRRALLLLAELCSDRDSGSIDITPLLCRLAARMKAPCVRFAGKVKGFSGKDK